MADEIRPSWGSRIDFFFNKMLPKKFLVIVIATIFGFMGILDGDMWAYMAMIYMGTNGLQHLGFNFSEMMKARKAE